MPLNTLRLNYAHSSHPNERIVFIKPLPRPAHQQKDYETADLLLRAIAAQCLPVMKSNYLSVTTLEEYEPNPEFIGRNFNNGEIIQLVLRSKSGSWLSVRMIQMVMMHELAHNMQMNHSKKFWEVRNKFAAEMRELWARGYTGDGLWGNGRVVGDLEGEISGRGGMVSSEELKDLPLCGGTFRSRGRRRKRKTAGPKGEELTWREKKERRIEKKFGKNGLALGEDEDKRLRLELLGKGPVGAKPRVAQSKRGRELRAAAALARFGTNKQEVSGLEKIKRETEEDSGNTDDGDEGEENDEYEDADAEEEDALDFDGKKLVDRDGRGMVRVCGDESGGEVDVKQEMDELAELSLNDIRTYDARQFFRSETHIPMSDDSAELKTEAVGSKTNVASMSSTRQYNNGEGRENSEEGRSGRISPATLETQRSTVRSKIGSSTALGPISKSLTAMKTDKSTDTAVDSISHGNQNTKATSESLFRAESKHDQNSTQNRHQNPTLEPKSATGTTTETTTKSATEAESESKACPICTTTNNTRTRITCQTCSHVLDRRKDPRSWQCSSATCTKIPSQPTDNNNTAAMMGEKYVNAGDCGRCGICGESR